MSVATCRRITRNVFIRKMIKGVLDYLHLEGNVNRIFISQNGWAEMRIVAAFTIQVDGNDCKVEILSDLHLPTNKAVKILCVLADQYNRLLRRRKPFSKPLPNGVLGCPICERFNVMGIMEVEV